MSTNDTTLTVVGNLTGDPELAFAASGTAYARFTVAATPRRYNRETGEWVDADTLFLRCIAWRELADHVAESLRKGTRVIATGTLRQSTWETPEGEKRSAIDLHVDEIGPSLRWATAKVAKAARDNSGQPAPVDPWAGASQAAPSQPAPATAPTGVPGFDEPPF